MNPIFYPENHVAYDALREFNEFYLDFLRLRLRFGIKVHVKFNLFTWMDKPLKRLPEEMRKKNNLFTFHKVHSDF